jgi:hypothetical protein
VRQYSIMSGQRAQSSHLPYTISFDILAMCRQRWRSQGTILRHLRRFPRAKPKLPRARTGAVKVEEDNGFRRHGPHPGSPEDNHH